MAYLLRESWFIFDFGSFSPPYTTAEARKYLYFFCLISSFSFLLFISYIYIHRKKSFGFLLFLTCD